MERREGFYVSVRLLSASVSHCFHLDYVDGIERYPAFMQFSAAADKLARL